MKRKPQISRNGDDTGKTSMGKRIGVTQITSHVCGLIRIARAIISVYSCISSLVDLMYVETKN